MEVVGVTVLVTTWILSLKGCSVFGLGDLHLLQKTQIRLAEFELHGRTYICISKTQTTLMSGEREHTQDAS